MKYLPRLGRYLSHHKMQPITELDSLKSETRAADLLRAGGVIALPTDTVYGFACSATCAPAIEKLYSVKSRDERKPVAICVAKETDVEKWTEVSHLPSGLLRSLLPGPVTLVLKCSKRLNPSLVHDGKVGVRVPDSAFVRNVVALLESPIALTSANLSDRPSSVSIDEFAELWTRLDGVFDGGRLGDDDRGASTVVDLARPGGYKVIREGVAFKNTTDVLNKFGLKPS